MIGTTIEGYKVISKISVGGMGTVYKAEHQLIGKLAAVKVLHKELATNRDIVNRFFNEAVATTKLKHPGIVDIYNFGYLKSGDAYIVMEYLEGMSLARRLKMNGKMSEGDAAMMLRSVCSALSSAHAKQIVHRDLKPDNIFLVPDPDTALGERPKLLDFGIAKLTDNNLASSNATKTGAVMGTPTYMSPEQCKGTGDVDHRADLYALGCIYYELVTGRPPFIDMGAGELIGAHLYIQPDDPKLHEPKLNSETQKLILSLLAKKPSDRPQSARELSQRLAKLASELGFITNTSPSGVTARDLPPLAADNTPVPVETTPLRSPAPGSKDDDAHAMTVASGVDLMPQPTTLSSAIGQSVVDVPRSRRTLWIAISGSIVAVGAVIAIAMYPSGDSAVDNEPAKPKPAPAAQAPTKPKPPAPAPAPSITSAPAPAPAPSITSAPAPAPAPAPAIAARPTPPPPPPAAPKKPPAKTIKSTPPPPPAKPPIKPVTPPPKPSVPGPISTDI